MPRTQKIPDPDPRGSIIAKYKVFFNKTDKHVMVLRFPNRGRDQPYNDRDESKPLALRVKPKTGIVEVDIPLNTQQHFDKRKSVEYGQAMSINRTIRDGGTLGLGGGLGISSVRPGGRATTSIPEESVDLLLDDFDDAVRRGKALTKLTLNGKIRRAKEGDPVYLIGVFKGDELHLTRISAVCTLTPGFQHLDAISENEKASARALRESDNPAPESKAQEMLVGVKSGNPEDNNKAADDIFQMLQGIHEEPWQHLDWIDETDPRSFEVFQEKLFLDQSSRGTQLVAALSKHQYLDMISAPRIDPIQKGKRIMRYRTYSDAGSSCSESTDTTEEDNGAIGSETEKR